MAKAAWPPAAKKSSSDRALTQCHFPATGDRLLYTVIIIVVDTGTGLVSTNTKMPNARESTVFSLLRQVLYTRPRVDRLVGLFAIQAQTSYCQIGETIRGRNPLSKKKKKNIPTILFNGNYLSNLQF